MALDHLEIDRTGDVRHLFEAQKNRGTDGYGFFLPFDNKMAHNLRQGRIFKLLEREASRHILFHHRNPSIGSAPISRKGCHPYSTKDFFGSTYVMVHNGTIINSYQRRRDHESEGIKYVSKMTVNKIDRYNDSESLLWDLALYLEGKADSVESRGPAAFVVIESKEGTPVKLHFGRNSGKPLTVLLQRDQLMLSSEGLVSDVPADILFTYDYNTREITERPLVIPVGWPSYQSRTANNHPRLLETPKQLYFPPQPATFKGFAMEVYGGSAARRYTVNGVDVNRAAYIESMKESILYETAEKLDQWATIDDLVNDINAAIVAYPTSIYVPRWKEYLEAAEDALSTLSDACNYLGGQHGSI